ncbi:hypothetical protein GCM10023347_48670 [Streptomyces chumphonensis]|uniref:Peptidase M11 gametolysin domain-containing protein n=1 Tax=Streptomyces chumphonensis TaxID=1214925 RepID=A0A927F0A6_9ACTN|nr:hypothetical protein [Streptomyces chumphonensis]MBD3933033.1 hypothetical protein [Streptomyces chumphonensis]
MHTRTGRILAVAASLTALAVGASASPAAADDAKTGRVLVVVANFADRAHSDPEAMRADALDKYFGPGDSLSTYFSETSRGRFTFVPAAKEKVIGPLTLHQKAGCSNLRGVREDAEAQVAAMGLERKKDWDHLSIVLPNISCYWSGMGSVGGRFTWLNTKNNTVSETTIRHEFGHNIGFGHQVRYKCKDGDLVDCNDRAAVAGRSPMGGNGGAGLSANQLIRMGWLETAEHQRVTGSGTFSLKHLYGSQNGTRALEIPMGDKQSLLLEYRRPSGHLDKNLDGVYAYRVDDGKYHTAVPIVLDTTDRNAGVTELRDDAAKVTVKVTGQTDDAATIAVGLDGKTPAKDAAPSTAVAPEDTADTTTPMEVTDPAVPTGPGDVDETGTDSAHQHAAQDEATQNEATQEGDATDTAQPSTDAPSGKVGHTPGLPGQNLAATGSDGTTLTLTAIGGTGLVLGGAFVAARRARSRRRATQSL